MRVCYNNVAKNGWMEQEIFTNSPAMRIRLDRMKKMYVLEIQRETERKLSASQSEYAIRTSQSKIEVPV